MLITARSSERFSTRYTESETRCPQTYPSLSAYFSYYKFNTLSFIRILHITTPNPTTTNFLYLEHSELQSDNLVGFKQHHQHLIIG